MKIPSTASLAATTLALVAPSVVAATDEPPLTTGSLEQHVFPATFVFELKADVSDSPELWALIQDAFVRSANEAHDETMMHFDDDRIVRARHQVLKTTQEEEATLDEAQPSGSNLRAVAVADSALGSVGRQYRVNYSSDVSIGCNFCTEDDDNFLSGAFFAGFYDTAQGQNILADWQKRFCGHLDKIGGVDKPTRCFIAMDFEHEILAATETA